jgi:hypothetical protein
MVERSCAVCWRLFTPVRGNAVVCGDKCRKLRRTIYLADYGKTHREERRAVWQRWYAANRDEYRAARQRDKCRVGSE